MPPSMNGVEVGKQAESVSLKFLLKQVYAAHVSKVRDLESEVKSLTQQLEDAKKEVQENNKSECEKCKEMQSAFNACKEYQNALMEQSKRLKELEMKFSSIDVPNLDCQVGSSGMRKVIQFNTATVETSVVDSFTDALKFSDWDETLADINRGISDITQKPISEENIPETPEPNETMMPTPPTTQSVPSKVLLHRRKIFVDEKSENRTPSNVNSTGNDSNDLVLVPDTLDVTASKKSPVSSSLSLKRLRKNKVIDIKSPDNKENSSSSSSNSSIKTDKNNQPKKRALSDLSVEQAHNKRFNLESVKDMLPSKDDEVIIAKVISARKEISKDIASTKRPEIPSRNVSGNDDISRKNVNSEASKKGIPMKKVTELLKEAESWASNFEDFDVGVTQAPSSVPIMSENKNFVSDVEINDDFQLMSSTPKDDELGSWKTSLKRNLHRKPVVVKTVKSLSRFRMTLEAPSANWKKPNYKQTKLSKSSFMMKNMTKQDSSDPKENTESIDSQHDSDHKIDGSSLCGATQLASLASADTTHLPDDLSTVSTLQPSSDMLVASNGSETVCLTGQVLLNADCRKEESPLVDAEAINTYAPEGETLAEDIEVVSHDNEQKANHLDSFDRLPVLEEPNYKYKEDCVRGKVKRKQLVGFECKECEKYYSELGLSEEEMKERMKFCSRHRAKYVPPQTPEHFWELDFPNTEECKARGYVAETQMVKLKSRRRRPLGNENGES